MYLVTIKFAIIKNDVQSCCNNNVQCYVGRNNVNAFPCARTACDSTPRGAIGLMTVLPASRRKMSKKRRKRRTCLQQDIRFMYVTAVSTLLLD